MTAASRCFRRDLIRHAALPVPAPPSARQTAVSSGRASYQVPVAEVISETDQACSLILDIPQDLADVFAYQPGQFLTVRVPTPGRGSVARCYSLCSSPHAGDRPAVTVKRMASGYASNWIADNVTAGSVLDLLPPAGTFTPPRSTRTSRSASATTR